MTEAFQAPIRVCSVLIPFTDEQIEDMRPLREWLNLSGEERVRREAEAALRLAGERAERQRKPRPGRPVARTEVDRFELHNERFLHFHELRSIYGSDW